MSNANDKLSFTLKEVMQMEYAHENNVSTHPVWPLAKQLADTMRENERLREALEYIAGSLRNSENDETLLAIRNVCDDALERRNKDSAQ